MFVYLWPLAYYPRFFLLLKLHDSLDEIGKNWKGKIGQLQKWWIGKPEGTRVELDLFRRLVQYGSWRDLTASR